MPICTSTTKIEAAIATGAAECIMMQIGQWSASLSLDVHVSDLDHSKQREQNQAHKGHHRYGVEAGTTFCDPICS
jgi:hypothetical protein